MIAGGTLKNLHFSLDNSIFFSVNLHKADATVSPLTVALQDGRARRSPQRRVFCILTDIEANHG